MLKHLILGLSRTACAWKKCLDGGYAEPLAWANSQNLGGGKFWLFAEAYLSNIFNLALI